MSGTHVYGSERCDHPWNIDRRNRSLEAIQALTDDGFGILRRHGFVFTQVHDFLDVLEADKLWLELFRDVGCVYLSWAVLQRARSMRVSFTGQGGLTLSFVRVFDIGFELSVLLIVGLDFFLLRNRVFESADGVELRDGVLVQTVYAFESSLSDSFLVVG